MPLNIFRYTYDYCKTNPIGFSIILILILIMNYLNQNYATIFMGNDFLLIIASLIIMIFIFGYGLVITKDVIRGGKKLPKIYIKECTIYGIKCVIVTLIYSAVQTLVMVDLSHRFLFPEFELEHALTNITGTLQMFTANDPILIGEYVVISIILTYIFVFFMEISLARLADGGKLLESFNLLAIKRCIDTIGWKKYTIDYTKLLLAITILTYLQYGFQFLGFFDYITDLIFGLLVFIIQFIGIGQIYKIYKIKKYSNLDRPTKKSV